MPLQIAYLDQEARFQFINAVHAEGFDCAFAALQGQPLREVVGDVRYAAIIDPLRRALAGKQAVFTGPLAYRSSVERRVRVTFIPHRLAADHVSGVVVVFEPVPEGAPPETPPASMAHEAAQLMRMRALGDMTIALAHELSQPLSATLAYIQGSLRQLRDGRSASAPVVESLERAAVQARRAAAIVGYIRRFARRDKPARRPVNLRQLLVETAKRMEAEAEASAIALSLALAGDLPPVAAEPIAIEQVILSLLHNSVEALINAPTDAPRQIRIASRGVHGNMVEIAISDTGPGIAEQVAEHLFEPFASEKPGGVGLGLAICRTIIREHGGELWHELRPDWGTTFVFTLPRAERAGADPADTAID